MWGGGYILNSKAHLPYVILKQTSLQSGLGNYGTFIYLLLFFFKKLYCPIGIAPLGNSGCFPTQPAVARVCWVFTCFHKSPNSDKDYRVFNVPTDVNACDCTRGVYGHTQESQH